MKNKLSFIILIIAFCCSTIQGGAATIQTLEDGATLGVQRGKINANFSSLNADKAEVSSVLSKTNTTPYTPSLSYHPATKLYADTILNDFKSIIDPNSYNADAFARANHTGTQAASTIVQDTSNRFVTDAEKIAWNAKEPAITKNTAFNKSFGTSAGTVLEGNHTDTTKADKIIPAASGNFAGLSAGGNLTDTGYNQNTFALDAEKYPSGGATNQIPAKNSATDFDTKWIYPGTYYYSIINKTGASEIASSTWAGSTIVHTPTIDAIVSLPETSSEAISNGFSFWLHNGSANKKITIQKQGSDILRKHAQDSMLSPGQTVFIQKVIAGSPNTWIVHKTNDTGHEKITANSVTLSNGTSTSVVADLQTHADGLFYHIDEQGTTPGILLIVDFINVVHFDEVHALAGYSGSGTHAVAIQVYNWTTTKWVTFDSLQTSYTDTTTTEGEILSDYSFSMHKSSDYIGTGVDQGKVRVRFYHTAMGLTSHDLDIDIVALYR